MSLLDGTTATCSSNCRATKVHKESLGEFLNLFVNHHAFYLVFPEVMEKQVQASNQITFYAINQSINTVLITFHSFVGS